MGKGFGNCSGVDSLLGWRFLIGILCCLLIVLSFFGLIFVLFVKLLVLGVRGRLGDFDGCRILGLFSLVDLFLWLGWGYFYMGDVCFYVIFMGIF